MTNRDAPRRAVRAWLASRGRTQGWLARELRMSDSLLSSVFNGYRAPSGVFLHRVQRLTGIDLTPYPRTRRGCFTGGAPPAEPAPTPAPTPDSELLPSS